MSDGKTSEPCTAYRAWKGQEPLCGNCAWTPEYHPDQYHDLRRRLDQMEKLVGGIDVENPDAVDTMIDAIKIQKENYQKFKEELLSGIKVGVTALERARTEFEDLQGLCTEHGFIRAEGACMEERIACQDALTTLNKLVEKYK